MNKIVSRGLFAVLLTTAGLTFAASASAQCAGCDADFNKADRAAVKADSAASRANRAEPSARLENLGSGMLRNTGEAIIKSQQKALDASKSD